MRWLSLFAFSNNKSLPLLSLPLFVCLVTIPRTYFMPLKSGAWHWLPRWRIALPFPLHIALPFCSCFIWLMMKCHRSALEWVRILSDKKCLCVRVCGSRWVCDCNCWCLCGVMHVCVKYVCGRVWPVEVTDVWIVLSQQEKRWFTCQGVEGQEGRYGLQIDVLCCSCRDIVKTWGCGAGTYRVQLVGPLMQIEHVVHMCQYILYKIMTHILSSSVSDIYDCIWLATLEK